MKSNQTRPWIRHRRCSPRRKQKCMIQNFCSNIIHQPTGEPTSSEISAGGIIQLLLDSTIVGDTQEACIKKASNESEDQQQKRMRKSQDRPQLMWREGMNSPYNVDDSRIVITTGVHHMEGKIGESKASVGYIMVYLWSWSAIVIELVIFIFTFFKSLLKFSLAELKMGIAIATGVHHMEGKIGKSKASIGYIMFSSWTREQDKAFEDALAIYSKDSIDRWEKIAAMVPGKTIEDIKYHFLDLVQDTNAIEAGHVPLPRYKESSSHGGESSVGRKGNHQFGKRPSNSCQGDTPSISDQDQRKGMAWTEEEHRLFLMGLDKYGKGDWRSISRNYVLTRTPTQVASHAQKYFIRLNSVNKGRRRSSIHDITSVDGGDSSTLLGPITGQMVGGGSSSRSANRTPLGDRGVRNYVPPTIVESNNNLIIPPAEIPEEAGTPVELLYDVGAPIPNDAFLLPL